MEEWTFNFFNEFNLIFFMNQMEIHMLVVIDL